MAETTEPDPDPGDGVQIDMMSAERMDDLTGMEKIRTILDSIHEGNIVILEEGLTPDEESRLIEVTMTEINPDGFSGIEIESYPRSNTDDGGLFGRIMNRDPPAKLTVIGPADQIETLHKDDQLIRALVHR